MKVIFLDTNIFIQCRDIEQLPWGGLFEKEEHIILVIPRTVQEEIDRFKQEGKSRRAKRARKANSFIRKVILSEDTKILIKDEKPLIEISFSPPMSNDCRLPAFLDLSRPDDRIIAEILRYRNKYPDHDVSILTHDTNPLLTAKRCGLSYYIVPDNWLLPPEPDSRDKKILELDNRIRELEKNYPVIEVTSADVNGNKADRFSIEVLLYDKLTEDEIDEIIKDILQKNPMKTDFSDTSAEESGHQIGKFNTPFDGLFGYRRKYIPPTSEEIERYQNEEYPKWIENVKKYLISLPEEFQKLTCTFSMSVKISNNGSMPAENIIIVFKALGDIYFAPPSHDDNQDKEADELIFPSPPRPPEGRWVVQENSILDSIERLNQLTRVNITPISPLKGFPIAPKQRDRNAFYWKDGRPTVPTKTWIFECDEFRHKIEPEIFNVKILFVPNKKGNTKCAVECLISAKNLPEPVKHYINLNVSYVQVDTFAAVREYLRGLNVI